MRVPVGYRMRPGGHRPEPRPVVLWTAWALVVVALAPLALLLYLLDLLRRALRRS